jgi:signal peptidase I
MKKIISENLKTLFYALLVALLIRSFLYQPFYIPSSSMEPTLLIGDRIFVSKYSYGYSRHSLPFSPNFSSKRYFKKTPKRGDVIVFKTPQDNRTDYIKRLIGLPGDTIQFINGELYLNEKKIKRTSKIIDIDINLPGTANIFDEILPDGKKYTVVYSEEYNLNKNSDKYLVPPNKYFFMGDNRDNSTDSRVLGRVGYVSEINLVGKAKLIFFSNDKNSGSFFEFWNWHKSIRFERFFSKIK